jgi:hypothetical protein
MKTLLKNEVNAFKALRNGDATAEQQLYVWITLAVPFLIIYFMAGGIPR